MERYLVSMKKKKKTCVHKTQGEKKLTDPSKEGKLEITWLDLKTNIHIFSCLSISYHRKRTI